MTLVKICGITNPEDAFLSVKFGADALGFNFYQKSPRYIAPERAREICAELPRETLKVGVFVNENLDRIIEIAEFVSLDAVQLHGDESAEFVRQIKERFSGGVIKALRVSENFQPEDVLQYEADAILLDAFSKQEYGGTGETFDWEIARKVQEIFPKMYLAGGLSSVNVDFAIRKVQPFAVDSCSLLEWEKGKKDKQKVHKFISAAKGNSTLDVYNLSKLNNIYDLLLMIEIHPSMFLGIPQIERLSMFLNGIEFGINILANKNSEFDWKQFRPNLEPHYAHGFQSWIAKKLLKQETSAHDWAHIILEHCNGDEEKAFDLFFALLEKFRLEKEDLSNK